MTNFHRRRFLHASLDLVGAGACASLALGRTEPRCLAAEATSRDARLRFGLVTYMWGYDWNLPTLLANCEKAGAFGVELRTSHAHGVEPSLDAARRREVRRRFAESPIALVGLGCNADFHDFDPDALKASINEAKAFIKLSHDVGGAGVKVKPNDLPPGVPHEKTIEQIGRSLNELGKYAAEFEQQVRLEVHGQCAPLSIIAAIMGVADHPNVSVCWNSNPQDLEGEGLEHNFHLVENRLGATVHARQLEIADYPYERLFKLLHAIDYEGWLLIEGNDVPTDRVAALAAQRAMFDRLNGSTRDGKP